MNIKEILEQNGVEPEKISALEKAINKAVGNEFVDKQRYNDKLTEIANITAELNTAKDELTKSGAWKQKYDEEVAAHAATKSSYTAEKEAENTNKKLSALFKEKGLDDLVNDKAVKLFDKSLVEFDKDGNIKNADKVFEAVKVDWSNFIGHEVKKGTYTGTTTLQNTGNIKNPWLKDSRNLGEQTRIFRENPALAVQMAKAAGIVLNE